MNVPLSWFVKEADMIVIGQITHQKAVKELGIIFTLYTLQIENVIKGEIHLPTLTIRCAGGEIGNEKVIVSEGVGFRLNEKVLVFLQRGPDETFLAMERYSVDEDIRQRIEKEEPVRTWRSLPLEELLHKVRLLLSEKLE
jgi:hypothetical protein